MKNIQIPPIASFISGIVLIVIARLPFFNQKAIIIEAVQAVGFIIAVIGFAGLIGQLFRKIFKKD